MTINGLHTYIMGVFWTGDECWAWFNETLEGDSRKKREDMLRIIISVLASAAILVAAIILYCMLNGPYV